MPAIPEQRSPSIRITASRSSNETINGMQIKKDTAIEALIGPLQQTPVPCDCECWPYWQNVHEAHRRIARAAIERIPAYPGGYDGRGIVIAAGGGQYFTNAYVCVRMLRHLGCRLPVQFWHHEGEIDDAMKTIVAPLKVACVNAVEVEKSLRGRKRSLRKGWELKPFALLYNPFREVMLLDADNLPVLDPAFLFDTPEFADTGAIFWPDYSRLEPWRHIWSICEVPYRDEPEHETGQIVVDKARCWEALNLALHYNDYSDFYYQHIHGDKDTFHFAFRRLDAPYSMPEHPIHTLEATMCQHDFDGRRLFQHRNMDKWQLDGSNPPVDDFWFEDLCLDFLSQLRVLWSGRAFWNADPDEREATAASRVAGKTFVYTRVDHDERTLHLAEGGLIGGGGAERERFWSINTIDDRIVLSILGESSATCHLHLEDGVWKGRWLDSERMPVELREIAG
jgi:Mannosyltransferase putative